MQGSFGAKRACSLVGFGEAAPWQGHKPGQRRTESAVADLTRSAPTLRNPRVTSVLVGVMEGACHGNECCARESDPLVLLRSGGHSLQVCTVG